MDPEQFKQFMSINQAILHHLQQIPSGNPT